MLAFLAFATTVSAQGLTPDEAVKRMQLPDGFSVRCVASEPMVRQPVSVSFDARGRMWVLQYLQYPNYAGLKPVKQDQYLRTFWDKTPEPPPKGPKGADRLTILSDPDEHGVLAVRDLVEKPAPDEAPSNLGIIGRYVLQPTVFDHIAGLRPGAGGELQLTDALRELCREAPFHAVAIESGRYDTGNKLDWLRATVELALEHHELGPGFRSVLEDLARQHRLG